jgi:DNA-binding PadR family transcriptional regulator
LPDEQCLDALRSIQRLGHQVFELVGLVDQAHEARDQSDGAVSSLEVRQQAFELVGIELGEQGVDVTGAFGQVAPCPPRRVSAQDGRCRSSRGAIAEAGASGGTRRFGREGLDRSAWRNRAALVDIRGGRHHQRHQAGEDSGHEGMAVAFDDRVPAMTAAADGTHRKSHFEFAPPRPFVLPAILLLLSEEPSYGYRLVGDLEDLNFGRFDRPVVDRALGQLEGDALVESWTESLGVGRTRRVDELTPLGDQLLRSWMGVIRQEREALDRVLRRNQATDRSPGSELLRSCRGGLMGRSRLVRRR